MMRLQELKTLLEENEQVRVVFRKRDGSRRVMICTRKFSYLEHTLGIEPEIKGLGMRYIPEEKGLINVWDLEVNEWRMVNVKTLLEIPRVVTDEDWATA